MSVADRLEVRGKDKATLRRWRGRPSRRGWRGGRIVLLAGDGVPTAEIARRVGVSRPTVISWRQRYLEGGTAALDDRPRPGRAPQVDEAEIVAATLNKPPEQLGVAHWSSRLLGRELGVGRADHAALHPDLGILVEHGRATRGRMRTAVHIEGASADAEEVVPGPVRRDRPRLGVRRG